MEFTPEEFPDLKIYYKYKKLTNNQKDYINSLLHNINNNKPSLFEFPPTLDKDFLYKHFLENIEPVKHIINPIRKASLDAVSLYKDNSLDFIFIDAAHDYENVLNDIKSWYPKVKLGTGVIAGHDYTWGPEVKKAVHDFFDPLGLQVQEQEGCWVVVNEK